MSNSGFIMFFEKLQYIQQFKYSLNHMILLLLKLMVSKTPNDFINLYHDLKHKGQKRSSIINVLIHKVISKLYHKNVLHFSARCQHLSKMPFQFFIQIFVRLGVNHEFQNLCSSSPIYSTNQISSILAIQTSTVQEKKLILRPTNNKRQKLKASIYVFTLESLISRTI